MLGCFGTPEGGGGGGGGGVVFPSGVCAWGV